MRKYIIAAGIAAVLFSAGACTAGSTQRAEGSASDPVTISSPGVPETGDAADGYGSDDYGSGDSADAELTQMAMEYAWGQATADDQDAMCVLFILDPETAMDAYRQGLEEDPTSQFHIDETVVVNFFDQKCSN